MEFITRSDVRGVSLNGIASIRTIHLKDRQTIGTSRRVNKMFLPLNISLAVSFIRPKQYLVQIKITSISPENIQTGDLS